MDTLLKTKLLGIDAYRDCENSWAWDNWFEIEGDIYLDQSILNNTRKLLEFCRRSGWLTKQSKGHLTIEDDGYNVVICNRKTHEPILAFCYGEYLD